MPKKPEYVSIAETVRKEVLAGDYDSTAVPSNATLAARFDVNEKTAGRAVQHLIAEGVLIARPGMRAMPAPPELRAARWPMTGRYARARAAQGLVFGDAASGAVRKDTVGRAWIAAPALIARFLGVAPATRVFHRHSRTYVDDVVTEDTRMHFPAEIVAAAPGIEADESIRVVALIEAAGHVVTRTVNEVRARLATPEEQTLFGLAADGIVLEHSHGTYGAQGEALESVINVRPAHGNVLTFDTYEAPVDTDEQDEQ